MSFISWFYRQLKKLDQSLDEFFKDKHIEYCSDGTIRYLTDEEYEEYIVDTRKADRDVPK